MSAQSTKLHKQGQVITGRRVKNKSLKIMQEADGSYTVTYSMYLLGKVISRKKIACETLREAEQCYEHLAFKKFKGKI